MAKTNTYGIHQYREKRHNMKRDSFSHPQPHIPPIPSDRHAPHHRRDLHNRTLPEPASQSQSQAASRQLIETEYQ